MCIGRFTLSKFKISSENMWHEINEAHGESGGVYILRCGDDKPISISRLLANVESGTLYIGKANSFINRVAELKKSISPKYNSGSHECGARYKSHSEISNIFPFEQLYLNLVASDDPRSTESNLLQEYEEKFGELPPLNRVS
jgi:hypothetical protein